MIVAEGTKARLVQTVVLTGATGAALQTALNTWFEGAAEKELVGASDPAWDGTLLNVVIYFIE